MKPRHEVTNTRLLSPSLNARRMKTDLKTSENVFLQSDSRSRSSSPILPQKTAKNCEIPKPTAGNGAMRCDWKLLLGYFLRFVQQSSHCQEANYFRQLLHDIARSISSFTPKSTQSKKKKVRCFLRNNLSFLCSLLTLQCVCERVRIGILLIFFFPSAKKEEKQNYLRDEWKREKCLVRAFPQPLTWKVCFVAFVVNKWIMKFDDYPKVKQRQEIIVFYQQFVWSPLWGFSFVLVRNHALVDVYRNCYNKIKKRLKSCEWGNETGAVGGNVLK